MSKKNIIIISSVVVIILLVAAGYYFYFYIFTKPNFRDDLVNRVISYSAEKVEPGDALDYEISYKNTGFTDVDTLQITIRIPDNTELELFTEGGQYNEEDRLISYTIDNIAKGDSGSVEYELLIDEPLDNGTVIEPGEVKFSYAVGEDKYEQVLQNEYVHTVESSIDLSTFSITSDDVNGGLLTMGDKVKYTIEVANTGNMIARDIVVKCDPSSHLSIVESSIGWPGELDNGSVSWSIREVKPGDTEVVRFMAKVESEELEDKEEVVTKAIVLEQGVEKAEDEVNDIVRLFPDFSQSSIAMVDTNGGGYLWAGETVNVKVTITNTGRIKADNYKLYCPIPAPATYVSNSGTVEGISWSDDIRGLIWDLNGLDIGQSKEISFNMTVNNNYYYSSGTITTDFYITSEGDQFDIEPSSIYIQGHPYLNVVAMGDSLIAMSDWVQRLDSKLEAAYPAADYNTTASGVGGEMSFEGMARFDSTVAPLGPHILIIAYGTNDTGASYSYFKYSIDTMVAKGKNLGATVFLNLIGPDLQGGKEDWPMYNQAIMEVAAKYGVPVINVPALLQQNPGKYLRDGVHYSSAGSEAVAQLVFNSITPYLNGLGGRK